MEKHKFSPGDRIVVNNYKSDWHLVKGTVIKNLGLRVLIRAHGFDLVFDETELTLVSEWKKSKSPSKREN